MTPVLIVVIIVVAVVIAGMMLHLHPVGPAVPAASPRKKSPQPVASRLARVAQPRSAAPQGEGRPPALADLAWDSPIVNIARKPGAAPPRAAAAVAADPRVAQRAKIRDRYLAARFPGVARTGDDLLEAERIVHAARLYFEERKFDRAIELLDLAIVQCPADESLALARLEIAFLVKDAALYVALAGSFQKAHPSSTQWSEVARLGRAIAPEEASFGVPDGPRDTDHYGPWPDMPNWIQAPWDLTAEVRAAEFHQAMDKRAA